MREQTHSSERCISILFLIGDFNLNVPGLKKNKTLKLTFDF